MESFLLSAHVSIKEVVGYRWKIPHFRRYEFILSQKS